MNIRIVIFLNELLVLNITFLSRNLAKGKDSNRNTIKYPAYLNVGKLKNHKIKIKTKNK